MNTQSAFPSLAVSHSKSVAQVLPIPLASLEQIMIIDDQQIEIAITSRIIKVAGFTGSIITYTSVIEALLYLSSQPYGRPFSGAVFLDLAIPVFNGFDFLEAIEHNANLLDRNALVYVLTSSNSQLDYERVQKIKCVTRYLSKPVTLNTLQTLTVSQE